MAQQFNEVGLPSLALDGETDAWLTATSLLDQQSLPGMWLVFSGWEPDKQIDLEGLAIQTKPEGQPDRKEMWVLNITSNLLIFKLDLGKTSMMLKEVREKKLTVKK